jgi:phosphorylase/glycogen(starch) synthase
MVEVKNKPDYLFEVSWEVCNKIGGIYTVISTKIPSIQKEMGDNYITIGPDVWKKSEENPYFEEDKELFAEWRQEVLKAGHAIKIGRWKTEGNPIAILIDFTTLFPKKDEIFAELWEKNQLDSLTGDWDYIEPTLFGYAAGQIIESFYDYKITAKDKFVAQFHEWMTGSGLLYLNNYVPQAGTIFTTHATVLGRSIAGNNLPLYSEMADYNVDSLVYNFGIRAKYSIEKCAADHADTFTTVSQLTANECKHLLKKDVDVILPNGFDDDFVPGSGNFDERRTEAREKLNTVATTMLKQDLSEDALMIIASGRYEFKNKGLDVFIRSLGQLNQKEKLDKEVVTFIMVPGNQKGADPNLIEAINKGEYGNTHPWLTHNIYDEEYDPVLNTLKENQLFNRPEDKVKVIFVPSYLNGDDGIFNMDYYDMLIGFDVSVFPSYYEPWGYTPLESLIYHVPTITTTLAGFGRWMNDYYEKEKDGVVIIDRNDENTDFVVYQLTEKLHQFMEFGKKRIEALRDSAFDISRIALWENLITHYFDAFSHALDKTESRTELFKDKSMRTPYAYQTIQRQAHSHPQWKKIMVRQSIPERLQKLEEISKNLWWCWNYEAEELFNAIDSKKWEQLEHNPIALLESLTIEKMEALEADKKFVDKLDKVYTDFQNYMNEPKPEMRVAYFSMEYGLHDTVKIFSGGLGMLAGDYLKEASDSNENMIGVGLLYRYGYFKQRMTIHGEQIAEYSPQKFTHLPLKPVRDENDEWVKVTVPMPGRSLVAKAWQLDIGRIKLYLLDTDIPENDDRDRAVTHQLYGGDWENRLKQEILLGIGGIQLLNGVEDTFDLYHCNEGHAALIGVERLKNYIQEEGFEYEEALELVRASNLFTTHTPVPAGHDAFDEHLIRTYLPQYANELKISWEDFMALGRVERNNHDEKFSMSNLAARLSQEMNGVSKIHGRVSREMFNNLYQGFYSKELHISHVTNGVHLPTWISPKMHKFYQDRLDANILTKQSDHGIWNKIYDVPDADLWNIRNEHRADLIDYVEERLNQDLTKRGEDPRLVMKSVGAYDKKALTFGFARRFATYKRAHLLFTNLERLAKIVNMKDKPVQFIFAGKAHPADKAGQDLIHKIMEISKMPEFVGKVTFIENYDMALGKHLTRGVDVWLNTPTRPLEASGTSGEKAVMNGVMNFSVLDGWWAEGYYKGAGWMIKEERTYENQQFQDELDAEIIYSTLEKEIIPAYYERNEAGIPEKWVSHIKNTIAGIAPNFTMKRMLDDYNERFYNPMYSRLKELRKDEKQLALNIAYWKKRFVQVWDTIEIKALRLPDSDNHPLSLGESFKAEIVVDTKGIDPNDLGFEVLFGHKVDDRVNEIEDMYSLVYDRNEKGFAVYNCDIKIAKAGVLDYVFRMFPKHELLPHRQDFNLVKWI